MLDFINNLVPQSNLGGHSIYIEPAESAKETVTRLKDINLPPELISTMVDIVHQSKTGGVIFSTAYYPYLILPPFPVGVSFSSHGLDTSELESILTKDHTIGVVLVRLGAYGVGVCRGEKLLSSKVGTGNIHSRHKKGGSSAHRFERHRDKQTEYFLTRVCQHAREHLEPHTKTLDYLVYGGARETIRELQKQCDFLGRLKTPTLPPILDIPDPRQRVLQNTIRRVWSSTVYEYSEED